MTFLLRFWPYLLAVVALACIGGWHVTKVHQADRAGRAAVQAKWDEAVRLQHEATVKEQDHAVITYKLEIGTGADLAPAPVVRVCQPAPTYPSEGGVAGGTGEGSPSSEQLQPVLPGRDVGPDLATLMLAADAVAARLRAVQSLH